MINQQSHKSPSWSDLYFYADAAREPFEDVTVVTARSQYFDLVYQIAADSVYRHTGMLSTSAVEPVAMALIASRKVHVQEHVRVDSTGITVCLDVPDTTNDDMMWRALDLVQQALDQLNGDEGTVYFGEDLWFSPEQTIKQMAL